MNGNRKKFQRGSKPQRMRASRPVKLPESIRLNRLIAACTDLSRRMADTAIEEGRVLLNGHAVMRLATVVHPARDRVVLDGRLLSLPKEHLYIAYYKPLRTL